MKVDNCAPKVSMHQNEVVPLEPVLNSVSRRHVTLYGKLGELRFKMRV